MFEFEWSDLKPTEKMLFTLLTISAVAATATFVIMAVKLYAEYLGYRKTRELVKVAHDILLADAQLRLDIYHRTQRTQDVSEKTAEGVQDLQRRTSKVERTAEQVKQVVVEGATPQALTQPKPRPDPPLAQPPTP